MGSEKGKKFKEGDTERDGVPGRTVMSPYDPLRPGEVQEVTLAEIASFSANGTKIGVGPLRAGNSVIPRGRTPDTIYFSRTKAGSSVE